MTQNNLEYYQEQNTLISKQFKDKDYLGSIFVKDNGDYEGVISKTLFFGLTDINFLNLFDSMVYYDSKDTFYSVGGLDRTTYNWAGEIKGTDIIGYSVVDDSGCVVRIDISVL